MSELSERIARSDETGAVARGWAVLGAVLVSLTVPMLYLQQPIDDSNDVTEESTSFWSALGEVLFEKTTEFGSADRDGLGLDLALARVGLLLLVAGLVLAVDVATRWIGAGRHAEAGAVRRLLVAALLAVGVVLVLVSAYKVGEPGLDEGVYQGIDAAAGLLAPLAVAVVIVSAPLDRRERPYLTP